MNEIDMEKYSFENCTKKPEGLSPHGKKAYAALMKVIKKFGLDPGGCTTFYSPAQWKERGEEYGCDSELIVVHDGGEVGYLFSCDYEGSYAAYEACNKALDAVGLWSEPCMCWYTAIYRK